MILAIVGENGKIWILRINLRGKFTPEERIAFTALGVILLVVSVALVGFGT